MSYRYKDVVYDNRVVSVPISPYQFRKCQAHQRELRFIEVKYAANSEDVVECQLHHELLDNVEYFVALSYHWGDPSCCGTVIIDGIEVPVAVNLIQALVRLRQMKCPTLWIDVLCINQEDDAERNAHLKLMKDIYHQADMVCAYIGPEADGSARIMDLLRHIDQSRSPKRADTDPREPWTPSWQHLLSLKPEITAFCNRMYWHRVWIIQEISLSSRLRVLCGSANVRWLAIDILMEILTRQRGFEFLDQTILYLCKMRQRQLQKTPVGLLQLLGSSASAESTNPRDRVYALLGLAFDASDYVTEPRYEFTESQICINITKTAMVKRRSLDIVLARTKETTNNLPSWCPDYFSAPSEQVWLRIAAYITGLDERFRMGRRSTRWTATENSIVTRRDLIFDDDGSLPVQGFDLGVVDSVGCMLDDPPTVSPIALYTPLSFRSSLVSPQFQKNLDEKCFKGLSRLLNAYGRPTTPSTINILSPIQNSEDIDTTSVGSAKLYYHLYDFERFYGTFVLGTQLPEVQRIQQWRDRNEAFLVCGRSFRQRSHNLPAFIKAGRLGDWLERGVTAFVSGDMEHIVKGVAADVPLGKLFPQDKVPLELEAALVSLADLIDEGLRLVTTHLGHLAWAHPSTQLGDHIYLLQGCSMPVVLRPTRTDYVAALKNPYGPYARKFNCPYTGPFTIVGHAIVDEAMEGNLWSNLIQRATPQWVTLQ